MAHFLISYDLVKRKDYEKLITELERLNGHKCLLSAWLLDAECTAAELRTHLKQYIDDDDRLIVAQITTAPAPSKCFQGTNDWIKARFG